ncbi:sialate:O-sulfotransferase 1-like [Macrobrachium nipponense]|uniref:sialate:O-sulfotransferase 1-like n=1 Tax=Macrobrachium nipponense TaxID=159736 RepID=UPI0030C88005
MWPDDPLCSQLTVRFGKNINGTWLLSFPRSGNTWTRYLIESASGFFTGSIYNARFPKTLGFLGEGDPIWRNRTILTKTHRVQPSMGTGRPVVMIIRNPARSIVSYWNYRGFKNETRRWTESVGKASYATAGFHRFVTEKLGKWRSIYKYALNNSKRLHVVFYEKLRENPLREIRDVLRFLQVRPQKERFLCLSRHLEGNAKGSQRHEDPYSLGEKKALASALEEINSLLTSRKFPPLPDYHKYDS